MSMLSAVEPGDDGADRAWWRRQSRFALALLLLLPLSLLWRSVVGLEVFVPFSAATFPPFNAELTAEQRAAIAEHANMDVTEIPVTFLPELQFVRDELAAGRLPHWNPHARFGAALLATSVVGLMYPPNWLGFLATDPAHGLAITAYLALVIAGGLMFGFLRARNLSPMVALFGAIAFAYCGFCSANLHFYQRLHAVVWLPGALWALTRMQQRSARSRRVAGSGLALCLAMSWLAGFPAFAAPATLVAAAYALCLCVEQARANGAAAARTFALSAGVFAGLGLLLAAVQLLPMFAFFPESNRDPNPTRDSTAGQAFDPMGFLGYLLPDAFGSPAHSGQPPYAYSLLAWSLFSRRSWDTGIAFQPNYNFIEYTQYPGALVLLLAIAGALGSRSRGWRWGLILTLAALWTLACAGPWTAAINDLPFVRSVPPMRFMGPASVLVAVLAALGTERAALTRARAAALAGLAVVLAAACMITRIAFSTLTPTTWLLREAPHLIEHYKARFPNATPELVQGFFGEHTASSYGLLRDNLTYGATAFALAAVWFALWALWARGERVARGLRLVALLATLAELLTLAWPLTRGRPNVPLISPALDLLRRERVARADEGGFAVIRGTATADTLPRALPPCLLVPERIRDVHAYTFVDARSHRLFSTLYGPDHMIRGYWPSAFPDDERLTRPLFDLLGVRYALSTDEPLRFGGKEIGLEPPPAGRFFVYERPGALPRAFIVPDVHELADEDAVIAAMTAPTLQPRAAVLVTTDVAPALHGHSGQAGAEQRAVRVLEDIPTALTLQVQAGSPGFLVVSDALMRGWTAEVNGVAVPIVRGNLFMRVLPIGSDSTEVRFTYVTPRLALGAAVSSAALLVLLGLTLLPRTRRRYGADMVPELLP